MIFLQHIDQITASWATIVCLSWFARLLIKVPARPTSWAGWLIFFSGITFMRWPSVYGLTFITDNLQLIRVILYSIVTLLHVYDWYHYLRLDKAERKELAQLVDVIYKKEAHKERIKVKVKVIDTNAVLKVNSNSNSNSEETSTK